MDRSTVPVSLELQKAKDAAIDAATKAFVGNALSTSQYEQCASIIEHAATMDKIRLELERHGLAVPALGQVSPAALRTDKVKCHGAKKLINDAMLSSRSIDLEVVHSSITMDYLNLDGVMEDQELAINAIHSTIKILVPDDYEIENRLNEVYSSFSDKKKAKDGRIARKIRLTGDLLHSSIRIVRPKKKIIQLLLERFL